MDPSATLLFPQRHIPVSESIVVLPAPLQHTTKAIQDQRDPNQRLQSSLRNISTLSSLAPHLDLTMPVPLSRDTSKGAAEAVAFLKSPSCFDTPAPRYPEDHAAIHSTFEYQPLPRPLPTSPYSLSGGITTNLELPPRSASFRFQRLPPRHQSPKTPSIRTHTTPHTSSPLLHQHRQGLTPPSSASTTQYRLTCFRHFIHLIVKSASTSLQYPLSRHRLFQRPPLSITCPWCLSRHSQRRPSHSLYIYYPPLIGLENYYHGPTTSATSKEPILRSVFLIQHHPGMYGSQAGHLRLC